MKKVMHFSWFSGSIIFVLMSCSGQGGNSALNKDSVLINSQHLDYLYTPIRFTGGSEVAGIYIYSEAPDYRLTGVSREGYTCVDDVARAALFYLRNKNFATDTSIQNKAYKLLRFILEMQAENGYFYNFLFDNNQINKAGITSSATPQWWSWRALQTLTEARPIIKNKNAELSDKIQEAIDKIISNIKSDLVNLPLTTTMIQGIEVPEWLPVGSGTDQAATLIISLITYCSDKNDPVLTGFIRKLADGIILMQLKDSTHFSYGAFLSWENQWHAYGNDQAYALLLAGDFLNDTLYITKALLEIDNFYPWVLKQGHISSFAVSNNGNGFQAFNIKEFDQIAYNIRPMVFAAVQAYKITGQEKYADIAGHMAAWFLGTNKAGMNIYSSSTGRCFDAITSDGNVNKNSGAESTIEALLSLQKVEEYPAVKTALNKYQTK